MYILEKKRKKNLLVLLNTIHEIFPLVTFWAVGVCHTQASMKKTRATAYLIGLSACLQSGFHVICNATLHSFHVAWTVKVQESSWRWWPLRFQNPDRCKYDLSKHLIWWRQQLQTLELSHKSVKEWISLWRDEVSLCGKSRVRSRWFRPSRSEMIGGLLDSHGQDSARLPAGCRGGRARLSALFVALQINRLPTQRVPGEGDLHYCLWSTFQEWKKGLLVFQSQSKATGGGRLAAFGEEIWGKLSQKGTLKVSSTLYLMVLLFSSSLVIDDLLFKMN